MANTNLGLDLQSSSSQPVNFFGEQSSLGGGAQFSFGGAQPVIWGGHGPGMPPWRRVWFLSLFSTYSHESWVMTERVRSQKHASEMSFLQRIEGVTLFNKVRSTEVRKSLNIKSLLLRIERSQLRWLGHVSRMPQAGVPIFVEHRGR